VLFEFSKLSAPRSRLVPPQPAVRLPAQVKSRSQVHRKPLRHADTASQRARAIAETFQRVSPQFKCKAEKRQEGARLPRSSLPAPPSLLRAWSA
jgi:hypothetical protein